MSKRVFSWAVAVGLLGLTAALLVPGVRDGSAADAAQRMLDTDGDGLADAQDNCVLAANPDQRDTDGDFYGNLCDPDLNGDGIVNTLDLGILRERFFGSDEDADFNGDGSVNVADLAVMKALFFMTPGPSGVAAGNTALTLTRVFSGLSLSRPIAMHQLPGDPDNWYVLERGGRIVGFEDRDDVTASWTVLNGYGPIDDFFEGGALGFAFHPNFASNGYLYVSYTADGVTPGASLESRIARFETSLDGEGQLVADAASELILIRVDQPYGNHNGGNLLFGPDGYLYWGLGDGGSSGDPLDSGQSTDTLLGSMLRLDVDVSAQDVANGIFYRVPGDNPFAGGAGCAVDGCPEIFAFGLRNPWRFSFDRDTGALWVGDVGQNAREEIDIVVNGGNYGWRCREGSQAYSSGPSCPPLAEMEAPIHDYGHGVGYSVTGGYVYRGSSIPGFNGMYVFADYGSGTVWGIYNQTFSGTLLDTNIPIVSFAEDLAGELYVLSFSFSGWAIYRLESAP